MGPANLFRGSPVPCFRSCFDPIFYCRNGWLRIGAEQEGLVEPVLSGAFVWSHLASTGPVCFLFGCFEPLALLGGGWGGWSVGLSLVVCPSCLLAV